MKKRIVILGAGLSGLSAAYFLKSRGIRANIFEKEAECGGLCRSVKKDGFIFDYSGHFLHFRRKDIFTVVRELLEENLRRHKRNSWIYSRKRLVPYPFQSNISHLPQRAAQECLRGFITAHNNGGENGKNFLEWIYHNFGSGIARQFMVPYNRKFWKHPLEQLSAAWTEKFIPTPSLKELVKKTSTTNHKSYNDFFWYPRRGGIEELIKKFTAKLDRIAFEEEAMEVNLKNKTVKFKSGRKEKFDTLISTIPLPELGNILNENNNGILQHFSKLKWLSIYNINLGISGETVPEKHWIYFPDSDIKFFRAGFFHNISPQLVPRRTSSVYVEFSYTKAAPLSGEENLSAIKTKLERTGILNGNNRILCEHTNDIKYAYPLYDLNYQVARKEILDFLAEKDIISCGRFGGWQYASMEDVIYQAKQVAKKI